MRKLAPVFTILLLLTVFRSVVAQNAVPQNSLIIKNANVTFTGSSLDPAGQFSLAGSDLLVTGGLREGFFSPTCVPCKGGDVIQIRSVYNGSSLRPGTLTVGGTGRDVFFEGDMTFDSNPIVLPSRYTRSLFRVTVPVTLQGYVAVHGQNPSSSPIHFLFGLSLNLHGSAILTLSTWGIDPIDGKPMYRFRGLTYEFPVVEKLTTN